MTEEYDEFHLDTGLKDDYDGDVVDAWFGNTEANPNLLLFLKVKDQETGEEVENRYGCGGGWGTFDGGLTAEHETGKKNFNTNTALGKLVRASFEVGGEEELRARSASLENRGPRDSRLWKGVAAHWEVKSEDFDIKDKDTGERIKVTSNTVLPTKFLAVDPVDTTPAFEEAAAAATVTSQEQAGGTILDLLPVNLATQIRVLAQAHPYPAWVDAVMSIDGVLDNATLMSNLGNEDFYNKVKG